ncbi:MAG TPA: PIG-L family deacetylase [Terracidiphilus sp.]
MFMGAKAGKTAASSTTTSIITAILLGAFLRMEALAQAPDPSVVSFAEPSAIALPLPEDRGASALEQALKRLHTTASVMMIVAHPDDEDGPLLTYLSRGLGVRCVLYTLTRGEGGQNVMSADTYDALGVIRTNELLAADEYYGAKQLWGTEADFGFSKTQEEAFSRWGHERVLYDAVLAVRRERPQVIVATFVGAVSDGHGQHQVSGEIAQEVFKAAGDPKVFPEQLKDGLEPWQPLAVYGMVPFAPINDKGMMFDYATGKWAPAQFRNYVTGEIVKGALSTDATMEVGKRDSLLGRSYTQIARQGWGEQRSQNGGANPTLSDPGTASYHLWAVAPPAAVDNEGSAKNLFQNHSVLIDTRIVGLAQLVSGQKPAWLLEGLRTMQAELDAFENQRRARAELENARSLAQIYKRAIDLRTRVADSKEMTASSRAGLLLELDAKQIQFQNALQELLGIDVIGFRTKEAKVSGGGFRGNSADETSDTVSPGEAFNVRVHTAASSADAHLNKISFDAEGGASWQQGDALSTAGTPPYSDSIFKLQVPESARPTQPFFTRPSIEQPYYNISNENWRERSFAPWPVSATAEFTFDGVPVRVSEVVQSLQRVSGRGGFYQPLVVAPAVGVSVTPEARILPLDGGALPVKVMVHTERAAEGTVKLKLPAGWKCDPAEAQFHRTDAGDSAPIMFSVRPEDGQANADGTFTVQAIAQSGGRDYNSGWRSVGYAGLRPYNIYRDSVLETRRVNVKLAPGLRIGYVMGPGDLVPDAIEAMGVTPHLLTADELASDLSQWNVIVIGIRAYATRPELTAVQPRLDEYVRNGGTLIVQYQSATFPAPLPLSLGRIPERVVNEESPVKLVNPDNAVLTSPNRITSADFDGWVEERGHSFLSTWDPAYTPLTETADDGQDPQRGGLVVAHPGKGTYVYVAYALYRQLPELVPGAYRLLANLLSAGAASPATSPR